MIDLTQDYESYYTEELRKDSKSRFFIPLAKLYKQTERLHEAIHILKQGLSVYPEDTIAKILLAEIYLESQQPNLALAEADAALYKDAFNLLGMQIGMRASFTLGLVEKAQYYAYMILKKYPNQMEALHIVERVKDFSLTQPSSLERKQTRVRKKIDTLNHMLVKIRARTGNQSEI